MSRARYSLAPILRGFQFLRRFLVFVAVISIIGAVLPAAAAEFLVDNAVYVGSSKDPISRSTTIFAHGRVYDYVEEQGEITVWVPDQDVFILLDPVARVRTELSAADVLAITTRLQQWARDQAGEFLQFTAQPRFDEEIDPQAGRIVLDSPWVRYELDTTDAVAEDIVRQYRGFCDWHARLNACIAPGSVPPFARLIVNQRLEDMGQFPEEVRLEIRTHGNRILSKTTRLRSRHALSRQLEEKDRKRAAQTEQYIAMFPIVPFERYQQRFHSAEAGSRGSSR